MLDWFKTCECVEFGRQLASELLATLETSIARHDHKFAAKAEKALTRADDKVRDFRRTHPLNFYKRSKLANSFLWTLKDGGCPEAYAQELTEWLSYRL